MDKAMIKRFFFGIKGPQLFSCLFFLGLGLLIILLSMREYKEYSQQTIEESPRADFVDDGLSFEEFQAIFASSKISSGDYEVVARKNLFSPERQAWQASPAKEDEQQMQSRSGRNPRIDPRAVKLYGITFSQEQKQALIYYHHLPDKNKHRLVGENESIYQGEDKESELFRIAKIDRDSVTLETPNGESFEIGLYAHERQVVSTGSQGQVAIVIGGDESLSPAAVDSDSQKVAQKDPSTSIAEDSKSRITGDNGQLRGVEGDSKTAAAEKEADPLGEAPQTDARSSNPLEALQKAMEAAGNRRESSSGEDMERQVQEGTMRRVDTPFGPIYRPVE
jgi:hypothetical protein